VGLATVAVGFVGIVGSFFFAPDVFSPDFDRASMKQAHMWMSQGAQLTFFGLTLGVLCEISEKLGHTPQKEAEKRDKKSPIE
jgi:hypothetical protein